MAQNALKFSVIKMEGIYIFIALTLCKVSFSMPQSPQDHDPIDNMIPMEPSVPNKKTTLLVPRSNNIQIAFAGQGDDGATGLHVDLLR